MNGRRMIGVILSAVIFVSTSVGHATAEACVDTAFFDNGSDSAKMAPRWVPGTTAPNQMPVPNTTYENGKIVIHTLQEHGEVEVNNSPKPCFWIYPQNWTLKDYYFEADLYPGGNRTPPNGNRRGYLNVTLRNNTKTPWKNFIQVQFPDDADTIRIISFCEGNECVAPYCVPDWHTKHEPILAKKAFKFRDARPDGKIHFRAEVKDLTFKVIINDTLTMVANELDAVPALPDTVLHHEGPPGICSCYDKSAFDNFVAGALSCTLKTTIVASEMQAPAGLSLRMVEVSNRGNATAGVLAASVPSAGPFEITMTDALGKSLWYFQGASQGAHERRFEFTVPTQQVILVSIKMNDLCRSESFIPGR